MFKKVAPFLVFSISFGFSPLLQADTQSLEQVLKRATRDKKPSEAVNPVTLLQSVVMEPLPNTGTLKNAVRIKSVQEGSIYDRIGLKKGDILTGIENVSSADNTGTDESGAPTSNQPRALEFHRELKNSVPEKTEPASR